MPGETNLAQLLKTMQPALNEGAYVFCVVKDLRSVCMKSKQLLILVFSLISTLGFSNCDNNHNLNDLGIVNEKIVFTLNNRINILNNKLNFISDTILKKSSKVINKKKIKLEKLSQLKTGLVTKNPFASIDQYALNCPKNVEDSIKSLASYLQKPAKTDLEKARVIYIWITKNINYDDSAYNSKSYGDNSAIVVLKRRKAVCEGFSSLFLELGKQMNLQIEKVHGYAKGYSYTVGKRYNSIDHAWNIIKIKEQWRVFDVTWGEGFGKSINGKLVSEKKFDDYWFNTSPYDAIFSHLPQNKNFANVSPLISLNTYENLPYVDENYFKMGFDGLDAYQCLLEKKHLIFPKCYSTEILVKVISAPKFGVLDFNKSYYFEFYVPNAAEVFMVDDKNNWTKLLKKNAKFKLDNKPIEKGSLTFIAQLDKDGKEHRIFLSYDVR